MTANNFFPPHKKFYKIISMCMFLYAGSELCRYHIRLMNCVIAFQFSLRTFEKYNFFYDMDINIFPRQLLNYFSPLFSLSVIASSLKLRESFRIHSLKAQNSVRAREKKGKFSLSKIFFSQKKKNIWRKSV